MNMQYECNHVIHGLNFNLDWNLDACIRDNKVLAQIEINDFRIMPYVRMTGRGKYIKPRAQKYIQNQNDLAWLIKAQCRKTINEYPIFVDTVVEIKGLRSNGDWDNYAKAVQDALVKAGVIADDCIKYVAGGRCIVKKSDRDCCKITLNMI